MRVILHEYYCWHCSTLWRQIPYLKYETCIKCQDWNVEYRGTVSTVNGDPLANFNQHYQQLTEKNKMPEIKFTQEDLLERTQLSPGWRTLVCKSIDEGPGKNDPSSIVYSCVFSIDAGPEKGVPIRHWFSEKAMGRIVDYIKCFVPGGKLEPGKIYELNQTVGLSVDGYCQYDLGQGYNTIKDWRPAQKATAAKPANDKK